MNEKIWYVRSEEGAVYGPASEASLLEWVKDGRVDPSGYVSKDRINWVPPQTLDWLEMKWLVETDLGKFFGPFHRELIKQLVADGSVSSSARIYCAWELPVDKDPGPVVVATIVEKPVEVIKEVRVEVPVEKIVEKIVEKPVEVIKEVRVEVPVEKIVEKIVEKPVEVIKEVRVEVPVEKIVEKVVVKEVEPPPRSAMVVPEVVDAIDSPPPRRKLGGIFKDADPERLAALEAAARKELTAAKKFGIGGLFGRK